MPDCVADVGQLDRWGPKCVYHWRTSCEHKLLRHIEVHNLLTLNHFIYPIIHNSNDEVAFCTLACQTRALLIVAEAQQWQQRQQELEHEAITASTELQRDLTISQAPPTAWSQGLQQDSIAGYVADYSPQQPSGVLPETLDSARANPKPWKKLPARPPLHTRHSVAIVDNVVAAASRPSSHTCTPMQHPIMNSLRSDLFSVSSVAHPHPHPSRTLGGGPPKNFEAASVTGRSPAAVVSARANTGSNVIGSSSPTPSSPSFFTRQLAATSREVENLSSAEALYRQHYPKFASRRTQHLREQSPSKQSHMSDNLSPSTFTDAQLLTPPSVIRPLLVLPEAPPMHASGDNPPPPTPASPSLLLSHESQLATSPVLVIAQPPLPASPLLRHTPERRSAPRRSLELSPNTSQDVKMKETLAPGTEIVSHPPPSSSASSNILRPALHTHNSGSGSGSSRRSEPLMPNGNNSLGLEIQHLETTNETRSASDTPPVEIDENLEPTYPHQHHQQGSSSLNVTKAKLSNPVSPPKLRSRLISMHTAPAAGRRELASSDGWRSVEASRYTLGPREASYIVRKLSEEQKRRQQKERSAAKEEAMENRGRSRVRKRAGSWGNPIPVTQSMACESMSARTRRQEITIIS